MLRLTLYSSRVPGGKRPLDSALNMPEARVRAAVALEKLQEHVDIKDEDGQSIAHIEFQKNPYTGKFTIRTIKT